MQVALKYENKMMQIFIKKKYIIQNLNYQTYKIKIFNFFIFT